MTIKCDDTVDPFVEDIDHITIVLSNGKIYSIHETSYNSITILNENYKEIFNGK